MTGRNVPNPVLDVLRRRLRGEGGPDDGIAMLTAILLIMVMAALSVLMLGVVTSQLKPTMFADKNSRTVFAAETGIDSALSQLRSGLAAPDVVTGKIYGDPRKLPCTVQGQVGATGSTLRYTVAVTYFDQNPTGQTSAWRTANELTCSTTTGVPIAPSFAVLSSQGSDAGVTGMATTAGDRTLETVYTFQVSNNNIDGGTVYTFGDTQCLQATGQTVGSKVIYVDASQCRDDDPRRLWTYGKDWALHLSVSDLGSTPLCITGNSSTGGNIDVTLTQCTTGNTSQMFSWQGGAQWNGENSARTNYSNLCLSAGAVYSNADLIGKTLKYGTCLAGNIASGSFDPDPRVGAGAAGKSTDQVVNFLEFGRCMDVTGENITASYMIVYPCKQDPSGGSLLKWNHKWVYSEPTGLSGSVANQQIVVKNGGSTGTSGANYCMTTPAAGASGFITMTVCNASDSNQKWTRNAALAAYSDSWTFVDRYGRCVSLGEKMSGTSWSKITVATCTGGPEQKWNAPAKGQSAHLDDYKELP